MLSAVEGEYVERFPTLRAALNYIEPATYMPRVARSPSVDKESVARHQRPPRAARATVGSIILLWTCAIAAMLVVLRWLSSDGGIADGSRNAELVAEKVLQDSLGDPDGTQFRNVMAYRVGPDNERWVCGWFNAKNAAGEFLGYRHFVVHVLLTDRNSPGGSVNIRTHLLISETEVPSMSYVWENYCR